MKKTGDELSSVNEGIDLPLASNTQNNDAFTTTIINSQKVDSYEEKLEKRARYFDKMDKHVYKQYAFKLLVSCGIVYLALVILDTVVTNAFSWESSKLLNGFIELIKFVISTLIGYVFSEIQKNKGE